MHFQALWLVSIKYLKHILYHLLYIWWSSVVSFFYTPYTCLVFQMTSDNVFHHHNGHMIGDLGFLYGWRNSSFEFFRKIALTASLGKARRGREPLSFSLSIRYNTHTSWRTTSTIQANGRHQPPFFNLNVNLILGHILFDFVNKTYVPVVTV